MGFDGLEEGDNMKRMMVIVIATLACLFSLVGCASVDIDNPNPKAVFYLPEGTIYAQGNSLSIDLNSSPSSGCNWTFSDNWCALWLKSSEFDKFESNEEAQQKSAEGTHTFIAEGTIEGTDVITLKYTSNKTNETLITYTLEVKTKNNGALEYVKASRNGAACGGGPVI